MTKIVDLEGVGFSPVFKSDSWQIACITYSEGYSKEGFNHFKRHLTTDEVFVLLKGTAVMHIYENGTIKDETLPKDKLYCVLKNTWHYLEVSEDALLVVAENADLKPNQTERMESDDYRK